MEKKKSLEGSIFDRSKDNPRKDSERDRSPSNVSRSSKMDRAEKLRREREEAHRRASEQEWNKHRNIH